MAIRTLVCSTARGNPILPGCVSGRALFKAAGQPEHSEANRNPPSGIAAKLPRLSDLTRGGQHRYHGPLACSGMAVRPNDSSRLAGGMYPNAVVLLPVSARHVCVMAETGPLSSHV